jgi:hypothetical protein
MSLLCCSVVKPSGRFMSMVAESPTGAFGAMRQVYPHATIVYQIATTKRRKTEGV